MYGPIYVLDGGLFTQIVVFPSCATFAQDDGTANIAFSS